MLMCYCIESTSRKKVVYMHSYTICNCADKEIFRKQCAALEKHIPGLQKEIFLHDVDDSLIQKYSHPKGMIKVMSNTAVDAVYVDSDFDLLPFFKKNSN